MVMYRLLFYMTVDYRLVVLNSATFFQSLSDSIVRFMRNRGFTTISYIDDFMIIASCKVECELALKCLTNLVEELGFTVNWDKVALPSQTMTFLGVHIDCIQRVLSLPQDKLAEVKTLLVLWSHKVKCTKLELQSLIGKLSWCSRVVRGGRTFIRNLIDLLPKVKSPYHYVRLSAGARSDISWWIVGLTKFHGSTPFTVDLPDPSFFFSTDACLVGGAGFCNSDWFYVNWRQDYPSLCQSHINVLELKTIIIAAKRWGASWSGRHILVRSDNMAAVAAINNTTSRSADLLKIVKELFWLAVEFNFKLSAKFLPGKDFNE